MQFISPSEFHNRLWPGETLSVLVHDMKKLLEQAMPCHIWMLWSRTNYIIVMIAGGSYTIIILVFSKDVAK